MSGTPQFGTPPGMGGGTGGGSVIVARWLSLVVLLVLGLLLLLVAIPVAICVLAVALIAATVFWLRRVFARTTEPNGVFDGRRNVRVIERRPGDAGSVNASAGSPSDGGEE